MRPGDDEPGDNLPLALSLCFVLWSFGIAFFLAAFGPGW